MIADRLEPGPHNGLTDVEGLRVGHHTASTDGFLTGTTVILAPAGGMVAGVDVRGNAPGTRETDLLHPTATVQRIDAVVLSGGSAYGLAACDGVTDLLAERHIGAPVGPEPQDVVPIVPGAVIFDLGRGGDLRCRPDAGFGRLALAAAFTDDTTAGAALGSVGAGAGAVAAGLKGGLGTASGILESGVTLAALVVVNAAGSPVDPRTGLPLAARTLVAADLDARAGGPLPAVPPDALMRLADVVSARPPREAMRLDRSPGLNTTLAVVATDATLTKSGCTQVARAAHDGFARALDPVHTTVDGDLVFGVATGARPAPDGADLHDLLVAAATVTARAITRAVLAARTVVTPAGSWPGWRDVVAAG